MTAPTLAAGTAAGTVICISCGRRPAESALIWPDRRFAVCWACIPEDLRLLAEPLNDDDVEGGRDG